MLALAALPLAARADFYLNVKSLAQTAAVTGNGDCAGHHQRWRTPMTCGGAGSFDIDRWVSGGPSTTTWHADFSRDDSSACTMRWDNGNTLTVTVK